MKCSYAPICVLLMLCFYPFASKAQSHLDNYIAEGLTHNSVLLEKRVSFDKAILALKQAKSLFLPSTNFEASYTLAGGGRAIEMPVGDLLNPVYQTLNQMTGSTKFPTIENVSEQLLPDKFYDVRIKTTMPVVNPEIRYNRTIKEQEIQIRQQEIEIYKRELIRDIKTAYYSYLAATEAIRIYESAITVVKQQLRITQSLLSNGTGLPAYVSRAESELKTVETELQTAKNQQKNACAYFNFLLNQPLNRSIEKDELKSPEHLVAVLLKEPDIHTREELKALEIAAGINENVIKMNRAFRTPRLNAFLDLGTQGFNLKVNDESFFYLGGIQLTIPIFQGNRNLQKIESNRLDAKQTELRTLHTKQQLELAVSTSRNNASSAYGNYESAVKRLEAAKQYFRLIERGYKEGVHSFIEYLDARNQLTSSQIEININKYKFLSALADLERQSSTYSIQ
jgi:outer membrane protein